MTEGEAEGPSHPVGLCARCRHHRIVESRRGSTFHLCGLSARDPRYPKYPQIPVLRCEGYEDAGPARPSRGD